MTCVTCQGQMEAPSVPSEPGSCASQVLKAAPPPRPPRPRGRGTGWLSGQEASGISEPRVQVLPVILSNYFFFQNSFIKYNLHTIKIQLLLPKPSYPHLRGYENNSPISWG